MNGLRQFFAAWQQKKAQRKSTINAMVMIVDPCTEMRAVLAEVLKAQHYKVLLYENQSQALERLGYAVLDLPNLVIIDNKSFITDGMKLVNAIKQNPERKIPIVIMANTKKDPQNYIARIGADGFLEKPFSEQKLLDILTTLLTKKDNKT